MPKSEKSGSKTRKLCRDKYTNTEQSAKSTYLWEEGNENVILHNKP